MVLQRWYRGGGGFGSVREKRKGRGVVVLTWFDPGINTRVGFLFGPGKQRGEHGFWAFE